jgi:hypothetical protein
MACSVCLHHTNTTDATYVSTCAALLVAYPPQVQPSTYALSVALRAPSNPMSRKPSSHAVSGLHATPPDSAAAVTPPTPLPPRALAPPVPVPPISTSLRHAHAQHYHMHHSSSQPVLSPIPSPAPTPGGSSLGAAASLLSEDVSELLCAASSAGVGGAADGGEWLYVYIGCFRAVVRSAQ